MAQVECGISKEGKQGTVGAHKLGLWGFRCVLEVAGAGGRVRVGPDVGE